MSENLKTFTKFETLEAKKLTGKLNPTKKDPRSSDLLIADETVSLKLKKTVKKKSSKVAWQLKQEEMIARKKYDVQLGFQIQKSLLKALFLSVIVAVSSFVRYSVVADSVEPVLFCVQAANLNIGLYNYLMLQDRALIDAIGWSDTPLLMGKRPSESFDEVSVKVRRTVDRMLVLYRKNRVGEDIDAYKMLMDTNMCEILAKTLSAPGETYPNCEIAMAGIVNNKFAIFIDKYIHLKEQIMSQWRREKTPESKRAVLYRQEVVSYVGYMTINTFGTTDAIYYHFMYPMVAILQGKVKDLQKALKLANVVTLLIGVVCIGLGILLQISIFRKEYIRFMSIIYIVPTVLLVSNAQLKFKLQQSLKECTSRLTL